MAASGIGLLTVPELMTLYCCAMACIKLLPLWSIGFAKVGASNSVGSSLTPPRTEAAHFSNFVDAATPLHTDLVQSPEVPPPDVVLRPGRVRPLASVWHCNTLTSHPTSKGMIPGAVAAIYAISTQRGTSPLLLLDGLCLFGLFGESIGRLGCHFYGCCFGRPIGGDKEQQDASPAAAFTPWSVVYIHRSSSVARLRPELLLRPLLPTQLLQTVFALLCQLAIFAYVFHLKDQLLVGTVTAITVAFYSVGRLLFFLVREDEVCRVGGGLKGMLPTLSLHPDHPVAAEQKFKSNRSYTTAYMAIISLVGAAAVAMYSASAGQFSPIASGPAGSGPLGLLVASPPSRGMVVEIVAVAAALAAVNFVVQGLHHHERVGQFPDVAALLGLSGHRAAPGGLLDDGRIFEAAPTSSKGQAAKIQQQTPDAVLSKRLAPKQVWSSWENGNA